MIILALLNPLMLICGLATMGYCAYLIAKCVAAEDRLIGQGLAMSHPAIFRVKAETIGLAAIAGLILIAMLIAG